MSSKPFVNEPTRYDKCATTEIPKCLWFGLVWYGTAWHRAWLLDICVFIIIYITISSHSTLSLKISSVTHSHKHMTHSTWIVAGCSFCCSCTYTTGPNFYGFHSFLTLTLKVLLLFCIRRVFPICLLFVVD